ncbi:hypothetical protein [Pseudoalteromonas sp.]|uniref:hypothetical protein n=1 Tax=Pseudoalteromonas sp. TaxID=53249 RepID=UPI0023562C94|nr:hypothetical protein [Pseudoalteromonas sp.]
MNNQCDNINNIETREALVKEFKRFVYLDFNRSECNAHAARLADIVESAADINTKNDDCGYLVLMKTIALLKQR